MKLSRNNKHFLSTAFKDRITNNLYSELKAASICCYTSEIIINLTEKDLKYLKLDLDIIQSFNDLEFLFTNEENHRYILTKTVIRSENSFITSMLNLNKVSKIKYFIELICLNKVEIMAEYDFFKEFFDNVHRTNFLYLYQTNKQEEYANIRFILQVESFYQKSFIISKNSDDGIFNNQTHSTNKNDCSAEKKMSMNNTTIKEVTEDEKNINANNVSIKMSKSQNRDSIDNININTSKNKEFETIHINENADLKQNRNAFLEKFKSFSFKNNNEIKKNLEFDENNEIGLVKMKSTLTDENRKSSNLLIFKSKNSIDNHNISTSNYQKRRYTNSKDDINFLENNDFLNDNILGELENIDSKITMEKKLSSDEYKTLQYDNNIDLNLDEKNVSNKAFENAEKIPTENKSFNKSAKELTNNKSEVNLNIPDYEKDHEENLIKANESLKNKIDNNNNNEELLENQHHTNKTKNQSKDGEEIGTHVINVTNKSRVEKNKKDNSENHKEKSKLNSSNNEKMKSNMDIKEKESHHLEKDKKQEDYFLNNNENLDHKEKITISHENSKNQDKENSHIKNEIKETSKYNNEVEDDHKNKTIDKNNVLNHEMNENVNNANKEFANTNNNFYSIYNNFNNFNFGSTHGTFYSKIKNEFLEDQIFDLNFNIGNYNYLYIDLDYTVRRKMKSTLLDISKFIQWAWENFRYMKFVIYFPKIQDFFLDLNQDLLKEINEIFAIADILIIEKKDLINYKKVLTDLSDFKKSTTSQFFKHLNNTASSFYNDKLNKDHCFTKAQKMHSQWEEFFLHELKIKKRTVPLVIYPTKTLIVLDELNKIFIYEKNYDNKLIFKTETDFILYPQINHTNQNIIELYRNCQAENYLELRGVFFGAFLSKIKQKPVKVDTIISKDFTCAYMISIELAKKILKIFFQQKPLPSNKEFYIIKLDKVVTNSKLAEDFHKRRESKFVLDCVNQKESYLKFYQPLNDNYLKEFFSIRSVSHTMKNFGFVHSKGKIIEPEKNDEAKKNESLKIGGKFYLKNTMRNLNEIKNDNFNKTNISSNDLNLNDLQNIKHYTNYSNFNMLSSLNKLTNFEKKGNSLLTRTNKWQNMITDKSNFKTTGEDFAKQCKNYLKKPFIVNTVFGKNITNHLPKINAGKVNIDPEEQMKDYLEFEKNLIIN